MLIKTPVILAVGLLVLFPNVLSAQTELFYQSRGNWYEGIKPQPVSGYDIELISVLVDYHEGLVELPSRLTVKFFLEKPVDAYLTVRERDFKHYYWLDRVQPAKAWAPGSENEFNWGTDTVLRRLKNPKVLLEDLGVLIRLKSDSPSADESVAPAILYGRNAPEQIQGYRFTMKSGSDAKVQCSVYKEGVLKALLNEPPRITIGGRPFVVRWHASGEEAGAYKLVVKGFQLDDNSQFAQVVHFYHRPNVK